MPDANACQMLAGKGEAAWDRQDWHCSICLPVRCDHRVARVERRSGGPPRLWQWCRGRAGENPSTRRRPLSYGRHLSHPGRRRSVRVDLGHIGDDDLGNLKSAGMTGAARPVPWSRGDFPTVDRLHLRGTPLRGSRCRRRASTEEVLHRKHGRVHRGVLVVLAVHPLRPTGQTLDTFASIRDRVVWTSTR